MNPNWQKRLKKIRNLFFAYARSKSRSKVKVGTIIEDSQGELHSESKVKAEMLNDFSQLYLLEKTQRVFLS